MEEDTLVPQRTLQPPRSLTALLIWGSLAVSNQDFSA